MLGVGLAIVGVGVLTGIAYYFRTLGYRGASGGKQVAAPPAEMTPDDQVVPEPQDADKTDQQQGIDNVKSANRALGIANEELPENRRLNPNLDDGNYQAPGTDYVSASDIDNSASLLTMMTGYVEEENPEYQGPDIE